MPPLLSREALKLLSEEEWHGYILHLLEMLVAGQVSAELVEDIAIGIYESDEDFSHSKFVRENLLSLAGLLAPVDQHGGLLHGDDYVEMLERYKHGENILPQIPDFSDADIGREVELVHQSGKSERMRVQTTTVLEHFELMTLTSLSSPEKAVSVIAIGGQFLKDSVPTRVLVGSPGEFQALLDQARSPRSMVILPEAMLKWEPDAVEKEPG